MRPAQTIIDIVHGLGNQLDQIMDTQFDSIRRPQTAIFRALHVGHFDLLLTGVLCRSIDQRMYLEPKIEPIPKYVR
jgi:hypothetical protein